MIMCTDREVRFFSEKSIVNLTKMRGNIQWRKAWFLRNWSYQWKNTHTDGTDFLDWLFVMPNLPDFGTPFEGAISASTLLLSLRGVAKQRRSNLPGETQTLSINSEIASPTPFATLRGAKIAGDATRTSQKPLLAMTINIRFKKIFEFEYRIGAC